MGGSRKWKGKIKNTIYLNTVYYVEYVRIVCDIFRYL